MRIAIIGAGNVGRALGGGWKAAGHNVVFGSRHPEKEPAGEIPFATIADAAGSAEAVVLCIPWAALPQAIGDAGPLQEKIVVDCTNPLKPALAGLELGLDTSAAEKVALLAPGASVFKAFNQTGAENMTGSPGYASKPVMFICGNDGSKKPLVLSLASDLGFEAVDAGDLTVARLLEPLAMLWIHLAHRQKFGRNFAFALLRRNT